MAHNRPGTARARKFILPLVVALPTFFVLFSWAIGWFLITYVEYGWDSGRGNVWQSLQSARTILWGVVPIAAILGLIWAWIIVRPLKLYKAQLDRLAQGSQELIHVDQQSEFSGLAASINRVLEEMGKGLPTRARSILDTLSSGVILFDAQGVIEWANPMAARLFETSKESMAGRTYGVVLERSGDLQELVRKAVETTCDLPQESVQINGRFGQKRPVNVRLAWVRDSDRKPVLLVLTVHDMSRLEAVAAGLRTAERLSSLGRIAAGIAHEVRNPLASIRGLAQLLHTSERPAREKVHSYTGVMIDEVDRVNRVIDRLSLLVTSHDEKPALTSCRTVLDPILDMASHLARKRQVKLNVSLEEGPFDIVLRPQHVIQALLNLVINGVEASPEGSVVNLDAHREGDVAVIKVTNSGPPIPPGELDDLFLPFHTTKDRGSGLGLAITDSIIRDHGGRVDVQSGNNRTIFTVSLPLNGPMEECESQEVSQGQRIAKIADRGAAE